jgi:DNA repair metallo-beta-lactamase
VLLTALATAAAAELETARQLQHHVPYSLHCSFVELCAFVQRLRPSAIRGIVKGSNRGGGGGGGEAICVADCVAAAAKHRCITVAHVAVTIASWRSLIACRRMW